jgi:hypothetical protein
MTAPITRELTITYGGYAVGGAQTSRVLRDFHLIEQDYEIAGVEFRVTLIQSSAAALKSAIDEIEAAFRLPFQDLTVTQEGQTLKSFSHASSTGFNSKPRITKRGEPTDTGRSRTYSIRIDFELPANNSGSSSRRVTKTQINVAYSPARRRTVTISSEYTANGSTSARDQFIAQVTTYAAAVLTGLGGTYKVLEWPTTTSDDDNKVLKWNIIYEEIIFTGVGSSNANIRKEVLRIARDKVGPGDTPQGGTVKRLVTLNVEYDCYLDATASTDLRGLYTSIRASIVAQVLATLQGGTLAVVEERPNFDYTDNHLSVSMTVMGATTNGIIECSITTETDFQYGIVQVNAWAGDPKARYLYQGPTTEKMTVTTVQKVLGPVGFGVGRTSTNAFAAGSGLGQEVWIPIDDSLSKTPKRLGIDPNVIDITEVTFVQTFERVRPVRSALPSNAVAT